MQSSEGPEVSIVIPLYNEEACVVPLLRTLDRFLETFDRTTEVVLVDDGSKDATLLILEEELVARPLFRVVVFRSNRGQTPAMAAGLFAARGEFIVFMDGDLQNDPADIPRLLEKIHEGYDLVSGWRRDRKDANLKRKIPSRVANWIIGHVTGVRVHDYGCSLKAYRANMVKPLELYSDMHRFLPALCSRTGARITEIVVRHHPRTLGASKYGLNRIFKVVADLIVIKMIISFHHRPMHYFGLSSLIFLAAAGVSFGFWIVNLSRGWHEGTIILPAVSVLLFCVFLYFLFLGLLSDMIVRLGTRDPAADAKAGLLRIAADSK